MVPVSTFGMDGGSLPVVPQVSRARRHGRGMRPAGGSRPFPQRKINDLTDEREKTEVRPISVEAEGVFSGYASIVVSAFNWR